ncbi:MAG: Flp pilus assembly protein CpaB [Bdellovibrionota bacterium]|nr:Flp pilus assembly protein CpaB [Pseudomonadota bacterium]MDY6090611.1 Flp pilus assembly protein CpaB [Bdellovibrionota bacterium]
MVQRRNSYINQRNKKKNQMIALIMICLSIIISSIIISSSNTPLKEEKVSVVAEFDTVKIPVPAKLVPMGTKVKDIKFKYVSFPKHQIPQGALTDLSGMQEAIALTKLPANIPVFDVNFSFTAYPQNPVVDKIPQGMRAMTIRVDATSAVEGWAGSGSLVDVLLVQKHKTSVIAEKVKILSQERSTAPVASEKSPNIPSTVTLLVTQKQCLAINTAIPLGRIAFALRSANDEANWEENMFSPENLKGRPIGDKKESIKAIVSIKGEKGKKDKIFALSGDKWIKSNSVPQGFKVQ